MSGWSAWLCWPCSHLKLHCIMEYFTSIDQRGWQARSDQGQLWVTAGEYSQICSCSYMQQGRRQLQTLLWGRR